MNIHYSCSVDCSNGLSQKSTLCKYFNFTNGCKDPVKNNCKIIKADQTISMFLIFSFIFYLYY